MISKNLIMLSIRIKIIKNKDYDISKNKNNDHGF